MLKAVPPRRSDNVICCIKKELMAHITVRNGRKYIKDGDNERIGLLNFKGSFISV